MAKKDVLEEVFGDNHELEAVLKQIKKQTREEIERQPTSSIATEVSPSAATV